MRILAYALMVIGVLLLANYGHDEYRGVTSAPSVRGIIFSGEITKQNDPKNFRNAMTCHWFASSLILGMGVLLRRLEKGQEKLDPFSPDFAGNEALDEWGDAMKKEEERRKIPDRSSSNN